MILSKYLSELATVLQTLVALCLLFAQPEGFTGGTDPLLRLDEDELDMWSLEGWGLEAPSSSGFFATSSGPHSPDHESQDLAKTSSPDTMAAQAIAIPGCLLVYFHLWSCRGKQVSDKDMLSRFMGLLQELPRCLTGKHQLQVLCEGGN